MKYHMTGWMNVQFTNHFDVNRTLDPGAVFEFERTEPMRSDTADSNSLSQMHGFLSSETKAVLSFTDWS
jgi:hypothetical protein